MMKRVESFYRFLAKNNWKFYFQSQYCVIYSNDGLIELTVDKQYLASGSDVFFVDIMFEIKKVLTEPGYSTDLPQLKVRTLAAK